MAAGLPLYVANIPRVLHILAVLIFIAAFWQAACYSIESLFIIFQGKLDANSFFDWFGIINLL
jgi:hypothetical protein